jgi:hypothetical protein
MCIYVFRLSALHTEDPYGLLLALTASFAIDSAPSACSNNAKKKHLFSPPWAVKECMSKSSPKVCVQHTLQRSMLTSDKKNGWTLEHLINAHTCMTFFIHVEELEFFSKIYNRNLIISVNF